MLDMIIKGDNGNLFSLHDISIEKGGFSTYVSIKSSWYQAKINFSSSHERIKAFIVPLE
ncbi:hypothetical protein [Thorsellia anophelis]|uniref:Uncharacterized protein n=1 Tax=Thorsellia anophelis DSM 18579 TaxID=1123402 RepID=A0A1I0DHX3_9GAMM|nr:hypothetical protein [Thorsellia anophelis]SET31923.1 hypothetical protein SAMN02583745_01999 [Thorsellia anophelis DSM 18579]